MEQQLSPEQLDLYTQIDEIIWKDWDPFGISKVGGTRDQYHEYLPDLFRLAQAGVPASEIAEYLHKVARDRMSRLSSPDDHMVVAEKIHDLYRER